MSKEFNSSEENITAGGNIPDEDLEKVAGGYGQFSRDNTVHPHSGTPYTITTTRYCDFAPDNGTFEMYFNQNPTDCPCFVWKTGRSASPSCINCDNYNVSTEFSS